MTNCIRAIMAINTTDPEEITRLLDHHIDYLIDMDANPEIKSIENVISYDVTDKHDATKLTMLATIVSDILTTEPSDEELNNDDDAINLYASIRLLQQRLIDVGLAD